MANVLGKGPDPWGGNADALKRAATMRDAGKSVQKIQAMLLADFGIQIPHRTLSRHLHSAKERAEDLHAEALARAASAEGRARVITAATEAIEDLAAEPMRRFRLYSDKYDKLMDEMSPKSRKSPNFVLGVGRLALDWFRLGASMAKVVKPEEEDTAEIRAALLLKVDEACARVTSMNEAEDVADATKH